MKTCANCGAVARDEDKFCGDCGAAFPSPEPGVSAGRPAAGTLDAASLARSIEARATALHTSGRKADIMFVLDCTGSMQGEIDAIKDAIMDFADTIKSDGVRVRVGLIGFRDRLFGYEPEILSFAEGVFTSDPAEFRRKVSALTAKASGDQWPESSLDAVMLALRQPFSADSNKVIVLITDAPPHIPDKDTKDIEEVVRAVREARVEQFYIVMRTSDPQSQIYLKLLEASRGAAFDLGKGDDFRSRAEDFKRTLMALGKTISAATR